MCFICQNMQYLWFSCIHHLWFMYKDRKEIGNYENLLLNRSWIYFMCVFLLNSVLAYVSEYIFSTHSVYIYFSMHIMMHFRFINKIQGYTKAFKIITLHQKLLLEMLYFNTMLIFHYYFMNIGQNLWCSWLIIELWTLFCNWYFLKPWSFCISALFFQRNSRLTVKLWTFIKVGLF